MEKTQISQAMPEIAKYVYVFAFVALLFVPLLFFVLWRMLVKPVHRIEVGLKRLGEGQQDYRISDFRSANRV